MLLKPKITSIHPQKSNKKSIPFFVKKDNRDNRLPKPKAAKQPPAANPFQNTEAGTHCPPALQKVWQL